MPDMESLRRALFEDPLYVYVSLAFVELALVGIWHARRTGRRLAYLAVPVVLAVAVFAMERLVVTDREQILQAMQDIAGHIEAGSFDPVAEHIDEQLTGAYGDKGQVVQAGRRILTLYDIKSLRYLNPRVDVAGDQAVLRVTTVIVFQRQAAGGRTAMSWRLRWIKRSGGWRILEVDRARSGVELQ